MSLVSQALLVGKQLLLFQYVQVLPQSRGINTTLAFKSCSTQLELRPGQHTTRSTNKRSPHNHNQQLAEFDSTCDFHHYNSSCVISPIVLEGGEGSTDQTKGNREKNVARHPWNLCDTASDTAAPHSMPHAEAASGTNP